MFDIINLYISSKRFKDFIFKSNFYKQFFESTNQIYDKKIWNRVLSFNFTIFLNRLKRNLEDNLEIFYI